MLRTLREYRVTLALQVSSFLAAILVIWLDELADLPRRFFGAVPSPVRIEESMMESAMVLVLAVFVGGFTAVVLKRIERLESFLVMCAWCNRVKVEEGWVPVEVFLHREKKVTTSHGICPDCAKKVRQEALARKG